MKNPWQEIDLLNSKVLIHPADLPHVDAYNKTIGLKKHFHIPYHLPPLPFTGNPQAPIFVLLANPGLSDKERQLSFKPPINQLEFRQNNMRHKPGYKINHLIYTEKPNPPKESKWYLARSRRLIEDTSLKDVAENLFFANFHPYHSKRWHNIAFTLHTQHYTFYLVREAIKRGSIFLMSRNLNGWLTSVPELIDYSRKAYFKSSRSVHISNKNLDSNDYKMVLKAFK